VTTLHLVRHGETEWNAQGRVQGQTDVPLSTQGRKQARELAERLAHSGIGAIWSSDLQRALDTAQPLAERLGLELHVTEALRERNFGDDEGKHDDEVWPRHPDSYWRDPDTAHPNGESRRDVWNRVAAFLDALLEDPPADEIALVSHGGPIRLGVAYLQHEEIASIEWRAIANVSVTTVEVD
jgi:2,3-bisphosphoglycerate-dependent phosphoglycerate mutase